MNDTTERVNPVALVRRELELMGPELGKALPVHIPVERFMRVVNTAIQNNPDLLTCNRKSLWNAAMRAAQDGLLPDGRDGAIVPYKGEAQWMPMIGGIRKKARNSGEIATWDVHAVYANDDFDYQLGDDPYIAHKPALKDRGEIIAVYSIATLKSGEKSRDVMGIEDVEKIRAISRSKNGPWANPTFYPEMAKKTVARRHSKVLPMSSDLDDLIRRDDHLYDVEGKAEAANAASEGTTRGRGGLADKFASIASTAKAAANVDPNTGEVTEAEGGGGRAGDAKNGAAEADPPRDNNAAADEDGDGDTPTDDQLADAKDRGAAARRRGAKLAACPPELRASRLLFDAWGEGWAEANEAAAAN
jgi:recombination protein RecT